MSGTAGSIDGYPNLLHRAIENLVRNAVKYTADASTVQITMTRTDSINIVVTDQGPGIDEEHLASVKDPFVRVTGTSRDRGDANPTPDGFGLGLTIAQRAIDIHLGSLELKNRTDDKTGLVASVSLPLTTTPDDDKQKTNR